MIVKCHSTSKRPGNQCARQCSARDPGFAALPRLRSFSTKAGFSRTTLCPAFHTNNFVLDYITDWTLWSTYSRSTNQFTNTFFLQKKLWYTTLWIHCLRLTQSPSPQDLLHPNRTRKDRLGHNSLKNFTSNREQRVLGHKE